MIGDKTDGANNELKGRYFEKKVVRKLHKAGFLNVTYSTTRSVRDNDKVDIVNDNEEVNGRFPYNIQCKTLSKHCDYTKILSEMPKGAEINVVIHRKTKNTDAGFVKQGTYAIMNADDFYVMIAELEARKL